MHIYSLLKLFFPSILTNLGFLKFKRFYYDIFFKQKEKIKFERNFFNRIAFIQKSISLFNWKKCKYLEIGVFDNESFNSIPLPVKNKFGVDPAQGGNIRKTSDVFFRTNKNKFNVIFIDGLHEYIQCQKDILNSLKSLKKNGIILIHDLLPKNKFVSAVPRKQDIWTGDVWKIAVELTNSHNVLFKIANIDHGIGILIPKFNYQYKKMNNELLNANFHDFYHKYYKILPIVNSEEALKFINARK
jgi:hypothetical protein